MLARLATVSHAEIKDRLQLHTPQVFTCSLSFRCPTILSKDLIEAGGVKCGGGAGNAWPVTLFTKTGLPSSRRSEDQWCVICGLCLSHTHRNEWAFRAKKASCGTSSNFQVPSLAQLSQPAEFWELRIWNQLCRGLVLCNRSFLFRYLTYVNTLQKSHSSDFSNR